MNKVVGFRTRLRPGMEEAYERAHAEVWPELVIAQRDLGIEHWSIFRIGVELFHVVECDDFERAVAVLSDNPIEQRWQAEMANYVVTDATGKGGAVERMRLVFAR